MRKIIFFTLFALTSSVVSSQTTVANPFLDVQGPLYVRQNVHTLNKANTGWVAWALRNTSFSETTVDLININKINTLGKIGVGTDNPESFLHVVSPSVLESSTSKFDANFLIEGQNSGRLTSQGASLGFVVPANTNGSNPWQQGRILVTPDNESNANASGRMYLQTRYLNSSGVWDWRNNIVLRSNGNLGIGDENPEASFHVSSRAILESSVQNFDSNLLIEGQFTSKSIEKGAVLGFALPANSDGTNIWQHGRIIVTPDSENDVNASGRMFIQTRFFNGATGNWDWRNNLVLKSNGNVGIGISTPDAKLAVNGSIHTKEVKVDLIGWSDFVFESGYKLPTLKEVETHILEKGHLQDIPSAEEVAEKGIKLGEMDSKLLQKIEELMLYTIQQQKEIENLKNEISELRKQDSK